MNRLPIAVAIPTKNEGLNIAEAVKSVLGHFEAVVVVDSHSTDDTAKIAAECGARSSCTPGTAGIRARSSGAWTMSARTWTGSCCSTATNG